MSRRRAFPEAAAARQREEPPGRPPSKAGTQVPPIRTAPATAGARCFGAPPRRPRQPPLGSILLNIFRNSLIPPCQFAPYAQSAFPEAISKRESGHEETSGGHCHRAGGMRNATTHQSTSSTSRPTGRRLNQAERSKCSITPMISRWSTWADHNPPMSWAYSAPSARSSAWPPMPRTSWMLRPARNAGPRNFPSRSPTTCRIKA